MSARLSLSADGTVLARSEHGTIRVTVRDRDAGTLDGDHAIAHDRGVWTISGTRVRRYSPELVELGAIELPVAGHASRVVYGDGILWGCDAPLLVEERDGTLATRELGFELLPGDQLVALTAHRFVRVRRGELALVDATGRERWRHDVGAGNCVRDPAPLFEGRWIAALTGRADAREHQLLLVDGRDGRLQHRIQLRDVSAARFTACRGLALLRAETTKLLVVDLRFGKVLRQHEEPEPITDLAIDDAGQRLVLGLASGALVEATVADLIAGRAPPDPVPVPAPATVTFEFAVPARLEGKVVHAALPAPLAVPVLSALAPRPEAPRPSPEELARSLSARRQLVAALAGRAIAVGWDAGTLAFVDEQRLPFEREVAGLVLGMRGLAAQQIKRTEVAVEDAARTMHELQRELGERDPLAGLVRELGMTELEARLLELVAAPALWGELARLYGILANDERRAGCDEHLLVQLCGPAHREAIARALDRDRPLVRHGLLHVAGDRPRPYAGISIEPLVLRILRGEPLDGDLDRGVTLAPHALPLEEVVAPRDVLGHVLRALTRPSPARLVVRGRTASGRRTVATAIAAHAGRRVGVVDAAAYTRAHRHAELAVVLRRTALRGWLPLVDHVDIRDPSLLELLREHAGPLAFRFAREASHDLPADWIELELPALTIGECADRWRSRLAVHALAVEDVDTLAGRFRVGPGRIERCLASIDAGAERALVDIERAMRSQLASQLGEVATRVERLPTWSQVVLPEDILDSVLELIARIRYQRTVFDTWGFEDVVTTARGVTALFQGPPGTGKTLVAGAIANELGLDLYRIDVSRVMSKWIGETEQNLAKVFAAAEDAQAILLFDEADSLFAKRTEVKSSNDRYANTEVNYLLQRLDSFEGIAILTTNFGSAIDNAFKRRLSFRLTFPFPDDDTREQLWSAHLPPKLPRAANLDLAGLARRFRMSGGYIRNAALRAAFLAAEERSALTQDHLERAIRAEFREIGNLADTGMLA